MKQGKERFEALPKETKELIIMYRKEHKLTYRQIEKRLDVSRETARLVCLENIPEEKAASLARKKKAKKNKVTNRVKTRRKPLPQYNSTRDYDFLQYTRVVFKWALKNHPKLKRSSLEMLLYLYPIGAFSYTKFHKYYKLIGIYQKKALEEFIKDGYIYVWKTGKNNVKLYALTDKAKKLCDMMHKYCVGDEKFPLNDEDELVKDNKTRINNYYLDMMKDMNKRKARN